MFDSCILPEHDFNPYDLTEPSELAPICTSAILFYLYIYSLGPKRTQHFFTYVVDVHP